jgi:hypothetical protein
LRQSRSAFWLASFGTNRWFAGLVICMVLPWLVGLSGLVGESGFVALLWIGFFWAMLLVMLMPLLLFGGPSSGPGPSDDGGPGPDSGNDRQPPPRPIGGIPLPDAEQAARRLRGPHKPRRSVHRRGPARERERPPLRTLSLPPQSSPRHRAV